MLMVIDFCFLLLHMLATENVICIMQRKWPLKMLGNIRVGCFTCLESLVCVLFLFFTFPSFLPTFFEYFFGCNSNYRIMNEDFSLENYLAKFCPLLNLLGKKSFIKVLSNAHIRGPHPKGKKETWPVLAFEIPFENLFGLNSNVSSPQSSWSWWTRTVGKQIITPAGNDKKSQSFVLLWTLRASTKHNYCPVQT